MKHSKNAVKHRSTGLALICYKIIKLQIELANLKKSICLSVWHNMAERLATDPVVPRSSPATGHTPYDLFVHQLK